MYSLRKTKQHADDNHEHIYTMKYTNIHEIGITIIPKICNFSFVVILAQQTKAIQSHYDLGKFDYCDGVQ